MRRIPPDGGLPGPPPVEQDRRDPHRRTRGQSARQRSLLRDDPGIDVVSMSTLVAIARAIEDEAVRRYALLAELMDRRGDPATAAAFRAMEEEERRHVVAVDRWAASVEEPPAAAVDFEWVLPADLSNSWEDIAGSALLTPYRAFAVAVENEERAFAFYAYLAANAENDRIKAEAEKLGSEELRHAALLRRWRRRAYHRERGTTRAGLPPPERLQLDSVEALRAFLAQQEAAISATQRGLAQRLEAGSSDEERRRLLLEVQKPLEALANSLEAVMAESEGELFDEAAAAMGRVIERLARVSLQID